MVISERAPLLQHMVCYFGPYDRVVVPVMSVGAHRCRFSREAMLQVTLAAPIAQENGFVFTILLLKKPSSNCHSKKKLKINSCFETLYFSSMAGIPCMKFAVSSLKVVHPFPVFPGVVQL